MTTQVIAAPKGVQFGDYVLTGKIGQGGIAEIYRGRQVSLGRDVAIKILSSKLSSDADIVRRFERESMVIARLNHPNIVHVIDRGVSGGRYYFVMELVDGTSLREVIDSQQIPMKIKLEMIIQVCKALDYAHKNGVIHRDIKPANILIDRHGNARVADFGIAQIVASAESDVTSSDVVMGTLAYMSPEQRLSSTNVDQTTDVYATGVIIYEILCGQKPLGHFKLPSEHIPNINRAFDTIIQRCLAQSPRDRYKTAVELKDAILNVIAGASQESTSEYSVEGVDSFTGNWRYLDTIKDTKHSSTILVENKLTKKLYVIKRHAKSEAGRKEASILGSLKHPNIINILGSGGDNRRSVIILDYAPGGSLADRMVRKYEWQKAMDMCLQIARGLDFAHRNNVIHGNLRPSNVLFDSSDCIKLTDFGLPTHYDGHRQRNWYSAPEHKISKQADLYAMGVIMHQLITGRNPQYDTSDNLRLDDIKMRLPEAIQNILRKLLAVRITNRYSSAAEMLSDYELYEADSKRRPIVDDSPTEPPSPLKPYPIWAIPAAAILVLAAGIMTYLLLS